MSVRDPGPALARAIQAAATVAGCPARILSVTTRDWASATFTGHRHRILLAAAGPQLPAWLAALAEAEWRLPGHIVADLAIDAVATVGPEQHVTLSVLTLDDA